MASEWPPVSIYGWDQSRCHGLTNRDLRALGRATRGPS